MNRSRSGTSGAVYHHGRECDEAGASGPVGDGWLAGEGSHPLAEVVGEHGAGEPGGVGCVVSRRDVFETGALLEVADSELDDGVLTMELIGFDGVEIISVGDEGVVAPVGP